MSDGKWRGTDKSGGARFFSQIPASQSGLNCPRLCCVGDLSVIARDKTTHKPLRFQCNECFYCWDRATLETIHKIDLTKFKL